MTIFSNFIKIILTGYRKGGKFHALIPNKETYLTFRRVFEEWGKKQRIVQGLQSIDLENRDDLQQKILKTWRYFNKFFGLKNEALFNSFFGCQYLWSSNLTHVISRQLFSGQGRIDTIFYPQEGKSNSVIIHEYKYTVEANRIQQSFMNPQKQQECLDDALWQIYEKNYMNHNLIISKNRKRIIVRPIAIVAPLYSKGISLYMENHMVDSFAEAQTIIRYFSDRDVKDTLMLNDKNRAKEESRANLLRKEEYKNIQELISVITSHLKPEKKMQTPPSPKKERESEFKYSFQGILLILITLKH